MGIKRAVWRVLPFLAGVFLARGHTVPVVIGLEPAPLITHAKRVLEALDDLGAPLGVAEMKELEIAFDSADAAKIGETIQRVFDHHCLFLVTIDAQSRPQTTRGLAVAELFEQGWRPFLVKVINEAGAKTPLRLDSPQAGRLHGAPAEEIADRWLDAAFVTRPPLSGALSGQRVEYRVVQLYSRDAGKRAARIGFALGDAAGDEKPASDPATARVTTLFDCRPSHSVTLRVKDEHGRPTIGGFHIRDAQDRVYPSLAKRLAPDAVFQQQIYRGDGDILRLPPGSYTVEFTRGPEARPQTRTLVVGPETAEARFQVERWIDPATRGWWSGDYHLHASGCGHYAQPTPGFDPADMIKHVMGEDLKVGAVLTWAGGFDYQSKFFLGAIDPLSTAASLLRYDIEVSGFGSHRSGHLCLLRLREQMFPGGDALDHWPTLGLNTLRWAKKQGAVAGAAHAGLGMQVPTGELPNFLPPPFSAGGANEYIVNVTHEVPGRDGAPVPAVDFVSVMSTPPPWELNVWYHTLNAGFRPRLGGETDWPCLYGKRVGHGRTYVNLPGKLDYDAWCEGLQRGASYVSDGYSHVMDLKIDGVALGESGSELRLARAGKVRVTANVAAWLDETPVTMPRIDYAAAGVRPGFLEALRQKPHWHVERARIAGSREVPVEVVVNGYPVAQQRITADGKVREVTFEVDVSRSSWIALRIYPSAHTNPIFVVVAEQPIRASRRSIEWCLNGVDLCWAQKQGFIKPAEKPDALAAYEHARREYRRRLAECEVE
jgi:hypothetical protein